MVTSKLFGLLVLKTLSVAVQVTVVVPKGKVSPELWSQVGVMLPSTVSLAVGVKVTWLPLELVAVWLISDGTVTGGVISRPQSGQTSSDSLFFCGSSVRLSVSCFVIEPSSNFEPSAFIA